MRRESEIENLKNEIEKLTGFINDNDIHQKEHKNEDIIFPNDVSDALSWVLEEISTEHFLSDSYLNIENLKMIAEKIEQKTGKN